MQSAATLDNQGEIPSIGELGKGQERYYLSKVAEGAEDYYSGEGEVSGRWTGDAAARLGLDGQVGEDQFVAMLIARNPADGELANREPLVAIAEPSIMHTRISVSKPKHDSDYQSSNGPHHGLSDAISYQYVYRQDRSDHYVSDQHDLQYAADSTRVGRRAAVLRVHQHAPVLLPIVGPAAAPPITGANPIGAQPRVSPTPARTPTTGG